MKQFINANQIKMAYQIDGPIDGPSVFMSNSLMSSLEMWDSNIRSLTDRYRVVRYDTRGHGQSEVTPGPYSISLLATDLVALMDALNIKQAHLVGLSMGGMICQYIGAHHPERVLSLSLCDTASEMPPRSLWEERFAIAKEKGIAGLVDGTIGRWFLKDFIEREPNQIEVVKKMILGTPLEGYLGCASAVRDMAQSTMLLKIKAPTMVLLGKQDPACTIDQATVLHRLISHSSMTVIDQAAHLSNIEKPSEFNSVLRKFLDSVS
ncbi:3-oxoadipate enol-lactonase [Polynucleobacter antarcticus]|uniref:3-oxoadipate enol-lactonase n=1 Tax=Polynucleobacter antarcticus TaxID=1743162 RepID=A0A6M9Q1U6_9BURK|nr:3-oxoadipate enol-lactonase [Polynucleobacter antarcticus]QKM62233.1 3-oxoadipate enol-lactonase [Polynucleobacter antarcticus]